MSGNVAKAIGFPPEDWSDVPPGREGRRSQGGVGFTPRTALTSRVDASADKAKWQTPWMRLGCALLPPGGHGALSSRQF